MKGKSAWKILWLLGILSVLMTGCVMSKTVAEAPRRYFWPRPPETPRVEWLGAYQNVNDIREATFWTMLTGDEDVINLGGPLYIASDSAGRVAVSDPLRHAFFIFDFKKQKVRILGEEESQGLFERPTGVAFDSQGRIWAGDHNKKKIFIFDRDEKVTKIIELTDKVRSVGAFCLDEARGRLILTDTLAHKIIVLDLQGNKLWEFGKRGEDNGEFNAPIGVTVNKDGEIFIVEAWNARVQRFSADGKFLLKFGKRGDGPGEFSLAKGIALDSDGHVYVTDGKNNSFSIFSDKGDYLLTVGAIHSTAGGKVSPGGFLIPQGICIDRHDTIYVVDQMNVRFQKFQYLKEGATTATPVTRGR